MAITNTRIADLVPSEKALKVGVNLILDTQNELVTSSLAARGPEVDAVASGGPRKSSIAFLNPLDTSEVNVSNDDLNDPGSVGRMSAKEFDVVRHDLNYAWGFSDYQRMITQYDAQGGGRAGIAQYWRSVFQQIAANSVKGVLASIQATLAAGAANGASAAAVAKAAEYADLVSGDAADAFDWDSVIDASATAGLWADMFNVAIVSPKTYALLQKQEKNGFIPASKTGTNLAQYRDTTLLRSKAFTGMTVLCRAGGLAFGSGTPAGMLGIELERVANGGKGSGGDILHSRQSVVIHPQGTHYKGAVAPTPAQLAEAGRWELAVPAEQFGFRFIKHA